MYVFRAAYFGTPIFQICRNELQLFSKVSTTSCARGRLVNLTAEGNRMIHLYHSGTCNHHDGKKVCRIKLLVTLMAPKTPIVQVAEWATGMRRTVDASTAA